MGKSAPESPLARRMRELEEEEKALQHKMKALTRQARRLEDELPSSRPAPAAPRIRPEARPEPPPARAAAAEVSTSELDILMGDTPASPPARPTTADRPPVAPGYAATVPGARAAPAAETERFANYFSSGSFGKTKPLGHEKRLQRNKAVFMVIFVLIVGYVFYRVFF